MAGWVKVLQCALCAVSPLAASGGAPRLGSGSAPLVAAEEANIPIALERDPKERCTRRKENTHIERTKYSGIKKKHYSKHKVIKTYSLRQVISRKLGRCSYDLVISSTLSVIVLVLWPTAARCKAPCCGSDGSGRRSSFQTHGPGPRRDDGSALR